MIEAQTGGSHFSMSMLFLMPGTKSGEQSEGLMEETELGELLV